MCQITTFITKKQYHLWRKLHFSVFSEPAQAKVTLKFLWTQPGNTRIAQPPKIPYSLSCLCQMWPRPEPNRMLSYRFAEEVSMSTMPLYSLISIAAAYALLLSSFRYIYACIHIYMYAMDIRQQMDRLTDGGGESHSAFSLCLCLSFSTMKIQWTCFSPPLKSFMVSHLLSQDLQSVWCHTKHTQRGPNQT